MGVKTFKISPLVSQFALELDQIIDSSFSAKEKVKKLLTLKEDVFQQKQMVDNYINEFDNKANDNNFPFFFIELKKLFGFDSVENLKKISRNLREIIFEIEEQIDLLNGDQDLLIEKAYDTFYKQGELKILIYLLQKYRIITQSKTKAAEGFASLTGFQSKQLRLLISYDGYKQSFQWNKLNPEYVDTVQKSLAQMIEEIKKMKV